MTAGRPTKYNDEILEKSREYLENFKDLGHAIPSVAGLGKVLRISRETLYEWAKDDDKKEFSDILVQLMSDQEFELSNGSLLNELNSNIAKMMLHKHGYKDRQDITTDDGALGGLFQVELVKSNESKPE